MDFCALSRALERKSCIIDRSAVQLKAPVNPMKVIGIGMNYTDHCAEQNAPIPKEPIVFGKFPNAIQDPYGPIILPTESKVMSLTFINDFSFSQLFLLCIIVLSSIKHWTSH